ncbi:MAG: hypothetical protein H6Q59_2789 [Firmicutes bacterium]|nr:hypothetical protein [Bacillota bacterium]
MLYNQKVKSDLLLPEAVIINPVERVDISIEIGEPPGWVLEKAKSGQVDHLEEHVMWIYLIGVVLFYVENGNHIIIYRESDQLPEALLRSYLTGSAMALAMMQKNFIPVHGGTVAWDGCGIIISGVSGSGKSTVTMELLHHGFRFVSDDVSVIDPEEDEARVFPGFPQQKVCRDVVIKKGLNLEELIYIDENRDKFARILKDGYITEPLPVACMIELQVSERVENVVCEIVTGSERFNQLTRNIYRGEVYQRLENRPERFQMFVKAAAKIHMYRIIRPKNGDHVDDIISCIRKEILHINSL